MGNIFSGSEIVGIGIQIEKNGRDFYSALAEKSEDQKSAALFKYLASEEAKHIQVFQGILDKTEKYEPQGLDADEYSAYMDNLSGKCVFTREGQGTQIAKTVKNDLEAVTMGIGFERDSIIFYEGMKKMVPDYDVRIIDELIIQEAGHLKQLADLKAGLLTK